MQNSSLFNRSFKTYFSQTYLKIHIKLVIGSRRMWRGQHLITNGLNIVLCYGCWMKITGLIFSSILFNYTLPCLNNMPNYIWIKDCSSNSGPESAAQILNLSKNYFQCLYFFLPLFSYWGKSPQKSQCWLNSSSSKATGQHLPHLQARSGQVRTWWPASLRSRARRDRKVPVSPPSWNIPFWAVAASGR